MKDHMYQPHSKTRRCAKLLLAFLAGCSGGASGHEPVATTARHAEPIRSEDGVVHLSDASKAYLVTQKIQMSGSHVTIQAPARVVFRDTAISRVGAPIPARVMQLHVHIGEKVKVGDALATLASPDASAFHAELARAKVELSSAQDTLFRQQDMLGKGVGREHEKVLAEMKVKDAEERVRAAKRSVGLLGRSFGGTVIVTSQIAGTVLRRNASIGAQVDPEGEPMFEIGDVHALWVVADVFQDDLEILREGMPVDIDVASRFESLPGTIASVGVMLDTAVRRAPVYIELKNRDLEGLKAGMFARASIHVPAIDGLTIPSSAILIKEGDNAIVYVEQPDGGYVRRDVALGHVRGGTVQILAGLKQDDQVVVEGALLLDGAANLLL